MTKATITRMWIIGLIVLVAGLLVSGISTGLMLGFAGHFTPAVSGNGSDFVPTMDGFFWTTITFIIIGGIVAAVGSIVQLAAWIGALVNTYQLADKAWFILLLIGGLLGFAFGLLGFAAMIAYLVGGPDGMAHQQPRPAMPAYQPPAYQSPAFQPAAYKPPFQPTPEAAPEAAPERALEPEPAHSQ